MRDVLIWSFVLAGTIFSLLLLINLLDVREAKAQSGSNESNTNISSINYASIPKEQTNFQQAANNYTKLKRGEAFLGPPKPVNNKEAIGTELFSEQFLQSAKDRIKRSESSINFGKTIMIDPNTVPGLNLNRSSTRVFNATMIDTTVSSPASISLDTVQTNKSSNGWKGLNIETANLNERPIPPDVAMAAGPNHVVQLVHHAIRVWDKNGTNLGTSFLDNFFHTAKNHFVGDQDALYDNQSGRWFLTIFDLGLIASGEPTCKPTCSIVVAVSDSNDPTGNYSIYRFPFGEKILPDYPHTAVGDDKFVFTVNSFNITRDPNTHRRNFLGEQTVIADKNAMISRQNENISYAVSQRDDDFFTVNPVRSLTSIKCPFIITTEWSGETPDRIPYSNSVNLFNICGNPLNKNLKINHLKDIRIDRAYLSQSAAQPPSKKIFPPVKIDTGDFRILAAVNYKDAIWDVFNVSCSDPTLPGSEVRSCFRIQKVNTTDYSLLEDRNLGLKGVDVFHPSITVNKMGEISIITGASSFNLPLSLLVGDNKYNFKALVSGTGPILEGRPNRYGDYSAAYADPLNDSFWLSGEYVDSSPRSTWSTYIGHISR